MKKSMLLLAAAVHAAGFTAHADKPVDENGTPYDNGFLSSYHDNLNIPGAQSHFTSPPSAGEVS